MRDATKVGLTIVAALCIGVAFSLAEFVKTEDPEVPPELAAAASAALRTMLGEADGTITEEYPVCVGLEASGWVDFPPGYIGDVMARNPGLVAASHCRLYEWWILLTGREERLSIRGRIPELSCGNARLTSSSRAAPRTIAMECILTCGPLCGYGLGFDVTMNGSGEFMARANGTEVRF